MSKYFNTTRGPIAVSLSSGKAITVPPKSWIEIDPADEGSSSLAPMIRKGYLKRSTLPNAPVEEPKAEVKSEEKVEAKKATTLSNDAVELLPPVLPSEDKELPVAKPLGDLKKKS